MNKLPKSRNENILVQNLDNEVLIYDLTIDKAFCLNETAMHVWLMCDGSKSVAEISQSISQKLKAPVGEDLVWLALEGLKKKNLLNNSEAIEDKFEGLSRREVIRKVGFASMIALPVISSVIAPTAAHAQSSNRAVCQTCSSPGVCASGNCATLVGFPVVNNCCTGSVSTNRIGCGRASTSGRRIGTCPFDCNTVYASDSALCCSGSASLTSCSPAPTAGQVDFTCTCN